MDEIETITEEEYEKLAAKEEQAFRSSLRDLPPGAEVVDRREEYWASKLPCGDDEVNK